VVGKGGWGWMGGGQQAKKKMQPKIKEMEFKKYFDNCF
jgi:hypothetical protein